MLLRFNMKHITSKNINISDTSVRKPDEARCSVLHWVCFALFTLLDAAVQQDGVSCEIHYIPSSVKGHLQITQILSEGVGLHDGNLPAVV